MFTPFDDAGTPFDGAISFDGAIAVGPMLVEAADTFVAGAAVGDVFAPGAVKGEVTS